jgi:hypothetical protein
MYESFGLHAYNSRWKSNMNQFDFSITAPTLSLRTGMLGERDWCTVCLRIGLFTIGEVRYHIADYAEKIKMVAV